MIQIRLNNGQTQEILGYKFGKFVTVNRALDDKDYWNICVDGKVWLSTLHSFDYVCHMARAFLKVEDSLHGVYRNGEAIFDDNSLKILNHIQMHYMKPFVAGWD